MKGEKKCTKLSVILFSQGFFLVLSLILSLAKIQNASAISVSDYGNDALHEVRSTYGTTGGVTGQTGTAAQQNLVFTMPYSWTVNNLHLEMTEEWFRANSIVHFNISYTVRMVNGTIVNNYNSLKYFGLHLAGGATILHDSCFSPPYEVAQTGHTFECSYTAFVPYTTRYIASSQNTRIVGPNDSSIDPTAYQTQLVITPISWITVNPNALTEEDRAWLESVLPDSTTVGEVEQAIENAREDEKEEYEDQQEDVEGGADDAGEEADSATSSLIDTAGNIIETIRDTPATNCVIRIQRTGFDTGNINLCNVPQQIRTLISTVITIPVTIAALHIAYSFVMTYLKFVRKEQE